MSDTEKKQESSDKHNNISSPDISAEGAPSADEAHGITAATSGEVSEEAAEGKVTKDGESSKEAAANAEEIIANDAATDGESFDSDATSDAEESTVSSSSTEVKAFDTDTTPEDIGETAEAGETVFVEEDNTQESTEETKTVFVADDVPSVSDNPLPSIETDTDAEGTAQEGGEEKADGDESANDDESASDEETDGDDGEKDKPDTAKSALNLLFDFVELVVISLAAVLLFTTFIMRHSVVEGSSMEGTLYENEHLMISDLFYIPERGDVVVCEDYSTTLRKPLIKRVIGLAGDRIQIEGETVKVNGVTLPEDYVLIDGPMEEYTLDIVIPEGQLFLMGDHRNSSTDSRDFGPVDEDSVIGKVLFRFYPFDKFGALEKPEYPEGIN